MTAVPLDLQLSRYRRIITLIWWTLGGALILALIALSAIAHLFDTPSEPLVWLMPQILPSMTLTGAVAYFGGPPKTAGSGPDEVRFLFRLAAGASLFYFLVLGIVIATSLANVGDGQPKTALDRLKDWTFAIGVLQALPASTIGVFFARN